MYDQDADDYDNGSEKAILDRMNNCIDNSVRFYKRTREIGDECLKNFAGGKYQWPESMGQQIQLTINEIAKYVRHYTNDIRNNFPEPAVIPLSEEAIDVAELKEGFIRRVMNELNSKSAIISAVDMQAIRGEGYFALYCEYRNNETYDQDIHLRKILDPKCVYFDPSSILVDRSDAQWCCEKYFMPKKEFQEKWPNEQLPSLNATYGSFSGTSNYEDANQAVPDDTVTLWNYWEIEQYPNGTLYKVLRNGSVHDMYYTKNKKEIAVSDKILDRRPLYEKRVVHRIFEKNRILETNDWPSKYLPIIPILGEQLDIEGERIFKGIVSDLLDPQKIINFTKSSMIQVIQRVPNPLIFVTEKQIEGREAEWSSLNVSRKGVAVYKHQDGVEKPTMSQYEAPIQALAQASSIFSNDLHQISGIMGENQGEETNAISGVAMKARKLGGDIATYHLSDNFAQSMGHFGRVALDMSQRVHDSEQTLSVMNSEYKMDHIKINQYTLKEGENKYFDMTLNDFDINIEMAPGYKSRREELAQDLKEFMAVDPQKVLATMGDVLIDNMYNKKELTARAKFLLAPEVQQYLTSQEENKKAIDPAIAAQLQASQQQITILQKALADTNAKLESKAMVVNKDLAIADLRSRTDFGIRKMENDQQLILKAMVHGHEAAKTVLDAEVEYMTPHLPAPIPQEFYQPEPQAQPQPQMQTQRNNLGSIGGAVN